MDAHKNFAVSAVATAPSPDTSGTSLVVTAGHGTRFPAVPFNASIFPAGATATPANAEIVRVTNISTDTFTITRAQESTSARAVIVGDKIVAAATALTFTDIETVATAALPKSTYDAQSTVIAVSDNTPVVLVFGASTFMGRKATGDVVAMSTTEAAALLTDLVPKSLYDANTVVYATTDNTPVALTVAASRIIGRKSSGDIVALTGAEAGAIVTAAGIPIVDAGTLITATDVEGALQELAAGTSLDTLAGYVHTVAANGGASPFSNSNAATTLWNSTKYDIPANSVSALDCFTFETWGTYLNNSGAARDLTISYFADAVDLGLCATSIGAQVTNSATARPFYTCLTAQVDSTGGSGVMECTINGWLSDINIGLSGTYAGTGVNMKFAMFKNTTATVDTTQALTLDVKGTMSTNTATQTITPAGSRIVKYNAP